MSTTNDITIIFLKFGRISGHPEDYTSQSIDQKITHLFTLYDYNTAESKQDLSGVIIINGQYHSKF